MFKATTSQSSEDEDTEDESDDSSSDEEDDELNELTIKFRRFLQFKKKELEEKKHSCHANKLKHHRKRQGGRCAERKNQKARVAYTSAIWGNSSDEDDEDTYSCLMALSNNEVSNSDSDSEFDFSVDELQDAYNEMHDEMIALVKALAQSKKKVISLENELEIEKNEKESLKKKIVELENVCETHTHTSSCDSCDRLSKEKEELNKVIANFTQGNDKVNILLGKQNMLFDKSGDGYISESKEKSLLNLKFFVPTVLPNSPLCTYCGKNGHIAYMCRIRRNGLSKSMKWVPKNTTNPPGPKSKWVPKCSSSVSYMQINLKKKEHTGASKRLQKKKASQNIKDAIANHKEKHWKQTSHLSQGRSSNRSQTTHLEKRKGRCLDTGGTKAKRKYEQPHTKAKQKMIKR